VKKLKEQMERKDKAEMRRIEESAEMKKEIKSMKV